MISGFTAVRNALRNGYPVVEAIRSALPLCDEVHVTDGFSDDGTFEILEKRFGGTPKVRLRQDRWRTDVRSTIPGGGAAIREALNRVRRELRGEMIFQFDANDILPVEDIPVIRELPSLYPRRELFGLPYRQFLGRYWFNEEFRFRFARNLPTIRVLWDGWTLGFHLGPADLLRPQQFRRILGRTALAVLGDRVAVDLPEQYVSLPRPVSKYYGLFPESFNAKMRSKEALQDNAIYRELSTGAAVSEIQERYRQSGDYDEYWRSVLDLQQRTRASGFAFNKEFRYSRYIPDPDHPEPVRHLLGQPRYSP